MSNVFISEIYLLKLWHPSLSSFSPRFVMHVDKWNATVCWQAVVEDSGDRLVWHLHGKGALGGCCCADWRCGARARWPSRRQMQTARATAPAHRTRKLLTITTTKTSEFMPSTIPISFAARKQNGSPYLAQTLLALRNGLVHCKPSIRQLLYQ
jgi:hypothetical protein